MNAEQLTIKEIQNKIEKINRLEDHPPNTEIELLKKLQYVEKKLDDETSNDGVEWEKLFAQLNALIVKVRFEKMASFDSAMQQRIEKAVKYAPKDKIVNEIGFESSRIGLKSWIQSIVVPTIRETDNVPAKRKAADDLIHTAQVVKEQEDDIIKRLHRGKQSLGVIDRNEKALFFEQNEADIKRLFHLFERLKDVSEEYRGSLSGSFHPSALQSELKEMIREVRDIQVRWKTVDDEHSNENGALMQLNDMIGLEEVKERVHQLYQYLQFQKKRQQKGFHMKDEQSLNMILTGHPGTGKTTIARLLARLYHDLGILPKSDVTEVDRSQLVGGYVGQTEENTMNIIRQAVGGVLFIDEAYTLKREGASGNDYGQTAIDTLVSAMTSQEYAGTFAVILAGYPDEMRQFLQMNPGLQSRFPDSNYLYLPEYSNEALLQVAEKVAFENDYSFTDEALLKMDEKIEHARVDESFGNARTVKNLVLDVIFQKGARTQPEEELTTEQFTLIDAEDVIVQRPSFSKDPDEELDRLVGLVKIKNEMKSLSSFIEIQSMRREQGLPSVPLQLHSVFVGNAGTGKTTVASVYANLLKKKGFLKRGHLIVAGRSDLVAGYTGQTAIKTKKKIREALGGVLFIDEAYALYSDKGGDYGKEAINTLVEEMTKHNENLVIILAGYPNEIQKLLNSNPGLSSRFKKMFHFDDYSNMELLEIMKRHASDFGYTWDPDLDDELVESLSQMKIDGNGRFAKDLVDLTIQLQAHRLMNEQNKLDEQALTELNRNDFEVAIQQMK